MAAQSTIVKAKCQSKKVSDNYGNTENPVRTEIELEVPYDQSSIYWKMSGGTNLVLNTINQEAADMFEIGKLYNIVVSPSAEQTPA